jgi:hypothetical protein
MVRLQCPECNSQVSVDGRNYQADDTGFVTVQEESVPKLQAIGFKISPVSMTVSQEDFDAIAANAKDLNLPVPGEVKVAGKQSARIKVE